MSKHVLVAFVLTCVALAAPSHAVPITVSNTLFRVQYETAQLPGDVWTVGFGSAPILIGGTGYEVVLVSAKGASAPTPPVFSLDITPVEPALYGLYGGPAQLTGQLTLPPYLLIAPPVRTGGYRFSEQVADLTNGVAWSDTVNGALTPPSAFPGPYDPELLFVIPWATPPIPPFSLAAPGVGALRYTLTTDIDAGRYFNGGPLCAAIECATEVEGVAAVREYALLVSITPTPAVPEPGTLALLGGGLLALIGMARRRRCFKD